MKKSLKSKLAKILVLACSTVSLFSGTSSLAYGENLAPRELGTYSVKKPAFLNLEKFSPDSAYSLVASSFGLSGSNMVSYIPNVANSLKNPQTSSFETLSNQITWPNDAKAVPYNYFNEPLLLVAGGFFVPGNSTGAVTMINIKTKEKYELSESKSGWFYHKIQWKDMNGDGKPDIVTARATKPVVGSAKGELIWLENPGTYKTKWKEHSIASGPDVNFIVNDIDNDSKDEIIAAEFFGKKLVVFWQEGSQFKSKVVDDQVGAAFDVQFVDINNDGKKELLATNHEGSNGSVYAYEIPKSCKTDKWIRHTLLTGIKTLQSGVGQASPGQAIAFNPAAGRQGKPYIVVAGDGSQKAHLLIPNTDASTDWGYTEKILVNAGCTVGQIAVADVNSDGYAEIFVPAYDKDKIYAFTYAP